MKNKFVILSVLVLVILTGCSMMGRKGEISIIGEWSGTNSRGNDMIILFNEDMTLTITVNSGSNTYTLDGKYAVDYSKDPVTVDLMDINIPQANMTLSCLGIAEFPKPDNMVLFGIFGQAGQITRPTEFERDASERRKLYVELKRSSE